MRHWIDDGEKYALVGLAVKLRGPPPPEHVTEELWALTNTSFEVPAEWRAWLGSIRTEEIAGCNLFLGSKIASKATGILDAESQLLENRVWRFYLGLLLSAMFSPAHRPILLTGSKRDGVTDVQQQSDLETPISQAFNPYPAITSSDIVAAAQMAQHIGTMSLDASDGRFWRIFRVLRIYVSTRAVAEQLDRIHQFSRCIEGLIAPEIGKTKKQFMSRTELFIGPGHRDLMGEIFDIRSHVEHLHENRYLEFFDRATRLDLLEKEAKVEYIARTSLARIVGRKTLWPHFGNTAALQKFWSLAPDERRALWGETIDPMTPLKDYDPRYIHDGQLGKS